MDSDVTEQRPATSGTSAGGLLGHTDRDPQPLYAQVLQSGGMVWDDEVQAWLVGGHELCTALLREDIEGYGPPAERGTMREGGSLRSTPYLTGDDHARMRRWWLDVFSPRRVEKWRSTIIRNVVSTVLDDVRGRTHADLWSEFALPVPVRVIAALLRLPWDDDDWVDPLWSAFRTIGEYVNLLPQASESDNHRVMEAAQTVQGLLMPLVTERRDHPQDDLISELWRDGPTLFDDWTERDVFAQVLDMFMGGTDTTSIGIANSVHRLLATPDLAERLRGDESLIPAFVEESLRLDPPVHYQIRLANHAHALGGNDIAADDRVLPLIAAANRDPDRWECPHELDLDRRGTHLAFSYGPRRCLGAAIARVEMQEAVRALLVRFPAAALDPVAEPPALAGRMLRPHRPLHVRLLPAPGT